MSPAIYLDYAAATPVDPVVLAVMQPYYSDKFYNPSATYAAAEAVRADLDAARSTVAAVLGARPTEIIFTAGGTEANNLAIHGIMQQYPEGRLLVSAIEHDSVLEPAAQYAHELIPVTSDGVIDLTALERLIDEHAVLVSVMYANNEIGTIQPLADVAQIIKSVRDERRKAGNPLPLYLHSDACQAGNYLDLHVSRLGVDLLTLNGGKIYGPKQSGALYVDSSARLQPIIRGGGQERNLRSGTENVAQSIGLAEALRLAQERRQQETKRLQQLQRRFIDSVLQALPAAQLNGSSKRRLPNNVHLTFPGQDNERLLFELDDAGVLAAAGSACSASSDEPSHVLRAIGLSDEAAQASLRLSFGRQTTAKQLETVVGLLQRFVR